MEDAKQFMKTLVDRLKALVNVGDVTMANEITANIMMGIIMTVMGIFTIVILILNECDVFTINKTAMRVVAGISLALEIPAVTLNKIHHGEADWLKTALSIDIVIMCAVLYCMLGHNAVLMMGLPILLSIRYYDEKLTRRVSLVTTIVFALATVYLGMFGLLDLNMIKETGLVIDASGGLREGINAAGIDRGLYIHSLFVNSFLPKFFIFSIIAIAAVLISKRGRETIELQREVSEKSERIATELNLATQIQTSMLPCIFPAFPEHGNLDLYAFNIPAKEVGGDFYDYFKIDDDHVALVMADVSGKGVGAALFMTISKIVIKNCLISEMSPAAAITKANAQICENNDAGLFVTAWAGIYQISTGRMVFTNAGHNPPIVRIGGESKYLADRHGLVLAGFDNSKYSESEITFASGDEIFLYTDGVTEATDTYNELYGEDRLLETVRKIYNLGLEDQIKAVKKDIDTFVNGADQFDDITMMGMKIK